mgnify:CR=1 FL=1
MGVVLVIALLCAPAVVALHSSLNLKEASLKAAAIGASCSAAGFGLSLALDLPPGPLIGLGCLLLLLLPGTSQQRN